MTRPLNALATVLLAATGLAVLVPGAATAAPPPDVSVIAHRGSSGAAPENTIAAVRLALAHRSDVVENDVQRTRDGELVIMHDTTLARTTDVEQVFPARAPWNVADFTLAEIKQLDAGSWFAPEFAGERVPTLAEWGAAVGRSADMLLEPKSPHLYPGIEQDLDKELRSVPVLAQALKADRVVVQSFDHPWLRAYADLAPDVPVGLLYGSRPPPPTWRLRPPGPTRSTPRSAPSTRRRWTWSRRRVSRSTSGPSTTAPACAARSAGTSTASSPTTPRCCATSCAAAERTRRLRVYPARNSSAG